MTGSPNGSLKDQTVLIIGRGSGLARAIALAALDAGARVIVAGREQEALSTAYAGEPGVSTEMVDLTDEASIAALGERLGSVDHVVATASARARGRIADLDRDAVRLSFDTKVIGPLMLAKHLAPRMNAGGSFVIFSGVAAVRGCPLSRRQPHQVLSGVSQPGLRRAAKADGGGNDPGAGDGGALGLRSDDDGPSGSVAPQRGAGLRPCRQVPVGPQGGGARGDLQSARRSGG